VQDFIVNWT